MRIDWYMLQSPARLAQPLVNPHQSAAVMVKLIVQQLVQGRLLAQMGARR